MEYIFTRFCFWTDKPTVCRNENRHTVGMTNRHTVGMTNRHTVGMTNQHTVGMTNRHTVGTQHIIFTSFRESI